MAQLQLDERRVEAAHLACQVEMCREGATRQERRRRRWWEGVVSMAYVLALDSRVAGVVREVAERFRGNKCPQTGGFERRCGGRAV